MADPQIEFAYPVAWPVGRPKTDSWRRKDALWRHAGGRVNWDIAVRRLREQVNAITASGQNWRVLEQTLSTNYELRVDGRPRRDRGAPSDPSVAFYFELDGELAERLAQIEGLTNVSLTARQGAANLRLVA